MTKEPLHVGAVIIGRNEGQRLVSCLKSVTRDLRVVVYVDSGSSDDSIQEARKAGVQVVELDLTQPFTAARARNEGLLRLQEISDVEFVQFIDGDCELRTDWIAAGTLHLNTHPETAVVFGRVRERFPDMTIYNRLADEEWQGPLGQAKTCAGISLMRVRAVNDVAGFNPDFIAGEEAELCYRLRQKGWLVWRLGVEMAVHDIAMTKLSQWWRRCMRGGYASALEMSAHGTSQEWMGVRRTARAVGWGLLLPLIIGGIFVAAGPVSLLLLLAYPAYIIRRSFRMGARTRFNWQSSFFLLLSKFPELLGVTKFVWEKLRKQERRIIEYK
ncbi:MAG: glycosyltransferase family 2 protein [Paracoccaceae bacterium]